MRPFPETPSVDDAPDLFESGHLWVLELVDGLALRFQLQPTGALSFGDRTRTFDTGDPPVPYRPGVRHVRDQLDRDQLRTAVDDVGSVVFFGVVPCARRVEYDWDRTPAFLGTDVWSGSNERFLSPDTVEQVYDRLGLDTLPAFQKEVDAAYFDVDDYAVPPSTFADSPAKGALFRNKTGGRAYCLAPAYAERDTVSPADEAREGPGELDPDELATTLATERRVDQVARELAERGRPVTFDAVFERVFERIVREEYHTLFRVGDDRTAFVDAEDPAVDLQAFRSAVAARTQELFERRE